MNICILPDVHGNRAQTGRGSDTTIGTFDTQQHKLHSSQLENKL